MASFMGQRGRESWGREGNKTETDTFTFWTAPRTLSHSAYCTLVRGPRYRSNFHIGLVCACARCRRTIAQPTFNETPIYHSDMLPAHSWCAARHGQALCLLNCCFLLCLFTNNNNTRPSIKVRLSFYCCNTMTSPLKRHSLNEIGRAHV